MGWQRLIPKYILENFKHGVFGFHASPLGLPFGKGRSPANWSMILGFQQVYSHFFQYNEKADDGFIYSTKKLDILPWDNIFTLKQKILFHQMNSIEKLLNDYSNNNIKLSNQDKTLPETFFPKREPSDGKIDLTKSTEKIFNLIRGCTKPFPGAFLYYDKNIIAIWDAVPRCRCAGVCCPLRALRSLRASCCPLRRLRGSVGAQCAPGESPRGPLSTAADNSR